jgi:hypothetical protein
VILFHATQIPQLVKLMTKQTIDSEDEDAFSALSPLKADDDKADDKADDAEKAPANANARSFKRRQSIRTSKDPDALAAAEAARQVAEAARQLAEAQRKLAESAGQMLFTLIQDGGAHVKKIIISAIIEKVQEPNTVPPEEVPALMDILRAAAEEQLFLVRSGTDASALSSALE